MITSKYKAQVDLLLQSLPYIAKEEIFALKGGTAINLFVRNLPRLSVDIDLAYLPLDSREVALKNIHNALQRIKAELEKAIKGINISEVSLNDGPDVKLYCQYKNAQIKIEVNTITRGYLFPPQLMQVKESVQEEFGKFATINVVSFAELYGGKICAALDRQHPRDLFDVQLLLENEGFTEEIRLGVIVGFLSHYKPIFELIDPIFKDQQTAFDNQFSGMTNIEFTYEDYENTRRHLIEQIKNDLTQQEKELIHSFENGEPDWDLLSDLDIKNLPAIKWKLLNIKKLMDGNPEKHHDQLQKLKSVIF